MNKSEKNEKEYLLQRKKWLSSIRNLSNNLKFDLAKREIIKYLSEYPYDEYAVVEYLKILIKKENYEEAFDYCDDFIVDNYVQFQYALLNKKINNTEDAKKYFIDIYEKEKRNESLLQLVSIYIKEKNYKKAYEYFMKIDDYNHEREFEVGIFRRYIYEKIYQGLLIDGLEYYPKQIEKFSEEETKKKLISEKNDRYKFSSKEKILNIYENVKEQIKNMNEHGYYLFDEYLFYSPSVGKVDSKSTNYIKVFTKMNTKDIIDIRPYLYFGNEKVPVLEKKL